MPNFDVAATSEWCLVFNEDDPTPLTCGAPTRWSEAKAAGLR